MLRAYLDERLQRRVEAERRAPFLTALVICFVVHVVLIALLIMAEWGQHDLAPPPQEVAVEVVPESEVPKPHEAPQQPAEPPQFAPTPRFEETIHRHQEAAPSQQKLRLEDREVQAARAEKENPSERDSRDDETRSKLVERPREERTAIEPEERQSKKAQQEQSPDASNDEQTTAPKLLDKADKSDAEVIEQAAPKLGPRNERKSLNPHVKAVEGEKQKSIAEQVAALAPTPEFKVAGRSHGAPVSGGSEEAGYLSVIVGLVERKFSAPRGAKPFVPPVYGIYIDQDGHLIHTAILRSSGDASYDQAMILAIHRAAPFQATPTGTALNLYLQTKHRVR